MTGIECVTNSIEGLGGCRIRGAHLASCDGWETALTQAGEVYTGKDCRGCMPRSATTGWVCPSCLALVRGAIQESEQYMTVWAQFDRLIQTEGAGGSSAESQVPLSPVALLVDELNRLLASFRGNTEAWVSTEAGAREAVMFARAFNAGKRAHPIRDEPRRVLLSRCPECSLKALMWMPPDTPRGRATIVCKNPACGHQIDEEQFEEVLNG